MLYFKVRVKFGVFAFQGLHDALVMIFGMEEYTNQG